MAGIGAGSVTGAGAGVGVVFSGAGGVVVGVGGTVAGAGGVLVGGTVVGGVVTGAEGGAAGALGTVVGGGIGADATVVGGGADAVVGVEAKVSLRRTLSSRSATFWGSFPRAGMNSACTRKEIGAPSDGAENRHVRRARSAASVHGASPWIMRISVTIPSPSIVISAATSADPRSPSGKAGAAP